MDCYIFSKSQFSCYSVGMGMHLPSTLSEFHLCRSTEEGTWSDRVPGKGPDSELESHVQMTALFYVLSLAVYINEVG